MSSCQELQEKIKKLKNLKSEFEAIYGVLPAGSNREPAKREVLDEANKKRDEIELLLEQIEKLSYWKKIKLGTFKTIAELRQAILDQGNEISDWGDKIFSKITVSDQEMEAALATATTKELTGKDEATTHEIYDAIRDHGDQLCPAEVGPQLRLQYQDQPMDEYLLIATEPIIGSNGHMGVFCVYFLSGGRSLGTDSGHPDHRYPGGYQWVFVSGK